MTDKKISGKAIILSLAFTQLGAVAQTVEAIDEQQSNQDLSGLIGNDNFSNFFLDQFGATEFPGADLQGTECFEGGVDSSGIPILPDLIAVSELANAQDIYLVNSIIDTETTVSNFGRDCAPDTVLSFAMPPQIELIATSGCLEDPSGAPVCTLDDIEENHARTVVAQFRVAAPGGNFSIAANASTVVPEENDNNNRSILGINVPGAIVPVLSDFGKWLMLLLLPVIGIFSLKKRKKPEQTS